MASLNLTVKDSDSLVGNYLKATKSFHPGDLILLESPALVGPNHLPDLVCLECLVVTNDKCTGCPAALCTNCTNQELKIHSTLECKVLSKLSEIFYPGILPLRLTLEFLTQSSTWEKLQGLQDHVEDNIDKPEWEVMHNEVVPFVMQCLSQEEFEDTLTKECILKCIGIICTNAIGVDSGGKKGRVLYEVAALASHNCQMNSVHQVNPTDFWVSFKACKPIKENDEITISYMPIIIDEPIRSQHIKNEWNFECNCHRCRSSSNSPLNQLKCDYSSQEVKILIEEAQNEIRTITSASTDKEDCSKRLENFYSKYLHLLGNQHFLLLICVRNWLELNPFGDFMGHDRITLCRTMLNLIKQISGTPYSEWSEFLYKDLIRNLLKEDGDKDNAQEKKNLLTLKVYSRELQKCRSLRFSRI